MARLHSVERLRYILFSSTVSGIIMKKDLRPPKARYNREEHVTQTCAMHASSSFPMSSSAMECFYDEPIRSAYNSYTLKNSTSLGSASNKVFCWYSETSIYDHLFRRPYSSGMKFIFYRGNETFTSIRRPSRTCSKGREFRAIKTYKNLQTRTAFHSIRSCSSFKQMFLLQRHLRFLSLTLVSPVMYDPYQAALWYVP